MTVAHRTPGLARLASLLPSPSRPLHGRRVSALAVPDNIVCFRRRDALELNRPQRGRALHHRHVLILALETAVTVCVDDRSIRLGAGEGLLVLPFQFHDYVDPEEGQLNWVFITFEQADGAALQALRGRPFKLTEELNRAAAEVVGAYLTPGSEDLCALLLGVFLAKVVQAGPVRRKDHSSEGAPGWFAQVNQLALRAGAWPSVKEMAQSIGISPSHLRTRFRASCGVSLGRHLRRLRLEKACGLLKMSESRVAEIGEQCGFASIYSFSRAFRVAYGVSPLGYRHESAQRARQVPVT